MSRGNSVIVIIVGIMALLIFILSIVFYAFSLIAGFVSPFSSRNLVSGTTANLETVDCSGAKIPKVYLPWIKQSAARFLGGDEAALLAVISIESNYNREAISSTGAVGLGQFVYPTAVGVQKNAGLFKGLQLILVPRADKKDKLVTEAEKQSFRQGYPYEGRLNAEASILATGYYFGNAVKKYNGDIKTAYAEGYNGSNKIQANGKTEKENASTRLLAIYNDLKSGGSCQELNKNPGQLGEELRISGGIKK